MTRAYRARRRKDEQDARARMQQWETEAQQAAEKRERRRPTRGTCFGCGKALSDPPGGVYSGEALFKLIGEKAPYPCKRCGTEYCSKCLRGFMPDGDGGRRCLHCSGNVGW